MQVQPYLIFDGRCEEALAFYSNAIGAEVLFMKRFKEAPPSEGGPNPGPEVAEKVMHATLRIGDNTIMASDGHCMGAAKFEGFSLSLGTKDGDEATRVFNALAAGGEAVMPLTQTFFASHFGMLKDRFGVQWMIIAGQ
jgi:PhnB protein